MLPLLLHLQVHSPEIAPMTNARLKSQEELFYRFFTVDDEEIKIAPIDFLEKLLNESIFPWTSPYNCVILVVHQKADRHYSQLSIVDWGPPLCTLMNFFTHHSQHCWDARTANVNIEKSNLIFLREEDCQLCGNCALANSSLSRKDHYLVFNTSQLLFDDFDGRVLLYLTGSAKGLIGTTRTS